MVSSVRDRQHAEDIIQEVGAAVSAKFTEIPEGVSFNTWALAIARNHIHKRYRADQRDRHLFKGEALESLSQAYGRMADRSDDMRDALEQCVDLLPDRSRRIVELRYKQGKRVDGIATMLGSTANAGFRRPLPCPPIPARLYRKTHGRRAGQTMTDPTRLIDRYLDGTLSKEELAQLEDDLANNDKVRRRFRTRDDGGSVPGQPL